VKCPTCGEHTPDNWHWFAYTLAERQERAKKRDQHAYYEDADTEMKASEHGGAARAFVSLDWMLCGNMACRELIVRIHERTARYGEPFPIMTTETWVARPRAGATRSIDPSVSDKYRRDFSEAVEILNRSPRMSAVMARRILADLLEEYDGRTDWGLDDRVRKFVEDRSHPLSIRENVEHLLKAGDFGAHKKTNDQDVIIEIDTVEAEWTLDLVERLFDYFIVQKAKDAAMRARIEQKVKDAGDKPIQPPSDKKQK
jgi:hypothetical protein